MGAPPAAVLAAAVESQPPGQPVARASPALCARPEPFAAQLLLPTGTLEGSNDNDAGYTHYVIMSRSRDRYWPSREGTITGPAARPETAPLLLELSRCLP